MVNLNQKLKIAILFPAFLNGGAESVALWMLEALKNDFDLTLVTFSTLDLGQLNGLYNTDLQPGDFATEIPYNNTPLPALLTSRYGFFTARQHLLLRYFKKISRRFDLAIGAFNEMDMGMRGIQYLNSPMFGKGHESGRAVLGYPDSFFRRIYHRAFEAISGFSDERMKDNLSVGNSAWTARLFSDLYHIDVGVLYPPVLLEPPEIPWQDRENGFVCVSRIVPEKNIERAIEIIQNIRERGFDVHLHLISSSFDPAYREKILKLQAERSSWVFLDENLPRTQLAEMLARHRYGIHVRENEQFGISVAEMVKAGCIPFVPASGGPFEIVDQNPRLTFDSDAEAVEKIVTVMSDEKLAGLLRETMKARALLFSVDRFKAELVDLAGRMMG